MASLNRWRTAQRYEQAYWERAAARIAAGATSQLDWYAWRAKQLVSQLTTLGLSHVTSGRADVIEIGSGPVGTLAFFPAARRVAVDPLEAFYGRDPVLTALRPSGVRYCQGVGELLPCPTHHFDLAIVDNCIDHVRDVQATMDEIARVLRPGGVLYLTVNCRTTRGFVVHRLLSRLRIDAGHPHTFTARRTSALLAKRPFRLLKLDCESWQAARDQDRSSRDRKARLKALLGTSEFGARLFAMRTGQIARHARDGGPTAHSVRPN